MMINSSTSYDPYLYQSPFISTGTTNSAASAAQSTSTGSTDGYSPSSGGDIYSLSSTYSQFASGLTPEALSYINQNSAAQVVSPDQLSLQNESSLASSLLANTDQTTGLSYPIMNSFDELATGDLTINMFSYMTQNNLGNFGSFLSSSTPSVLLTTDIYQQAYNQTSRFLQNYNSIGQQVNASI